MTSIALYCIIALAILAIPIVWLWYQRACQSQRDITQLVRHNQALYTAGVIAGYRRGREDMRQEYLAEKREGS